MSYDYLNYYYYNKACCNNKSNNSKPEKEEVNIQEYEKLKKEMARLNSTVDGLRADIGEYIKELNIIKDALAGKEKETMEKEIYWKENKM